MAMDAARTRWCRAAGALLGASVVLVGAGACSSDPPPPARQYTVQFSVSGTSGGNVFGRYVTVGQLGSTEETTFAGVPFSERLTVPYPPAPALQASAVGVPPGSRLSCQITVDGQTVAAQTVSVPGQDVICRAG
ncbi:hypothetical protein [Actinomycetospora chiangmaiensis]|uniref:hypothetical protein n=1 Tax=Actinomycetospora chiangmaiensis TaxID=402650 RepID=UPI0003A505D4|nr:hypothetical protein [Actinomycetospora chiangmaiensis]